MGGDAGRRRRKSLLIMAGGSEGIGCEGKGSKLPYFPQMSGPRDLSIKYRF